RSCAPCTPNSPLCSAPAACCSTATISPLTPRDTRSWPGWTRRCASARTSGASPAGIRRTGATGGTPRPPIRCWPVTWPNAPAADVAGTELHGLAQRQLEHLLGLRRERDVPGLRQRLRAAADGVLDRPPHLVQADPHRGERPGRDALALVDEPEQDVLGADV